jgi:hypothetical protein
MFGSVGKSAFEMSAALFRHIVLFLNFAFRIFHGEAYRQRDHFGFWVTNQSVLNLSSEPCKPEKP